MSAPEKSELPTVAEQPKRWLKTLIMEVLLLLQALHSSLLPSSLECLTMLLNNQEASLTNMARCQESTLVSCNRQESA